MTQKSFEAYPALPCWAKLFRPYGPAFLTRSTACIFAIAVLLGLAGCTSKPTTLEGPVARVGEKIDPATVGSVSGTVSFTGTPPKRMPIDMGGDPACSYAAKEPSFSESVLVADGKLENAFVYVKQGPDKYAVPVPEEPAVLDQKGCRYHPHVMGLVAGQKLRIMNSDPAMHNVNPTAVKNERWNVSQMPGAAPIEKTFTQEELMLPLVCNQHPWMKMYVNVVKNPFFAVTDADGKFAIKGLPPGEYTLAVVHEKLGAGEEVKITLAPREDKQGVHFTYAQAK